MHQEKKRRSIFEHIQQLAAASAAEEKSGRWLYAAWLGVSILPLLTQPASATTIWEKATEIMKDVYQQILLISTIAAIVTASVALADDELFPQRPDRRGIACMAQTHCNHLGDPEWSWLHHGTMSRRSSPAVSGRHKSMGILDGVVEWISEQIMHGLDLINTSVLGALGWDGYVSALLPRQPRRCTIFYRHRYRPDFIDVGLEPV